jgi:hypothetical protein
MLLRSTLTESLIKDLDAGSGGEPRLGNFGTKDRVIRLAARPRFSATMWQPKLTGTALL